MRIFSHILMLWEFGYLTKMKEIKMPYSLKNIPIASRNEYMPTLSNTIEDFLAWMRWKALFTLQRYSNSMDNRETFQFKTRR